MFQLWWVYTIYLHLNVSSVLPQTVLQAYGMIQIMNYDPQQPTVEIDEETHGTIQITIGRIGGCKYAAEAVAECIPQSAKALDYQCDSKLLKWADKDCSEKTFVVFIVNDDEYEEEERFLFRVTSGNIALGFNRITFVIARNDLKPGQIVINPSSASIVEGMPFQFHIERTNGNVDAARVCYQVIGDTALIPFDLKFKQECVEWQHLDSHSVFVSVETIVDDLWEADEIFHIALLNVEGASLHPIDSYANITILQNHMNVPFVASTIVPCTESKPDIRINPITDRSFFVQFEPKIPTQHTVNDAHIVVERLGDETDTNAKLQEIGFRVDALVLDETVVSCDNIPVAFEVLANHAALNCVDIIQHTNIIDSSTEYACNYTVDCMNLNASIHREKYINSSTEFASYLRKQRIVCQDLNQSSQRIACECDFPTNAYGANDWVIRNADIGQKHVSRSFGSELAVMAHQPLWTDASMVTFRVTVSDYLVHHGDALSDEELLTRWWFYLVTDVYPCQQTNWTQWSLCDAIPVGIGHQYRSRLAVHGLPSQPLVCTELKERKTCVVNQEKTVSFATNNVQVREGLDGEMIKVRLMHELTSNTSRDKNKMGVEQLAQLKGYDVMIDFVVPMFYRKEIAIDPKFVAWHKDDWDEVHEIRISAMADANIDKLEQSISVTPKIYSIDTGYSALTLAPLTVTVLDTNQCTYCGMGNVRPMAPPQLPVFWDAKSIVILGAFLLMISYFMWQCIKRLKSKYAVEIDEYTQLVQDMLVQGSPHTHSHTHTLERSIHTASSSADDDLQSEESEEKHETDEKFSQH